MKTWVIAGMRFVAGGVAGVAAFGMLTALGFIVWLIISSFLNAFADRSAASALQIDGAAASAAGMANLAAPTSREYVFEQVCRGPCDDLEVDLAWPTRLVARNAEGRVIAEAHADLADWTNGLWPTPRWKVGGAPLRIAEARP